MSSSFMKDTDQAPLSESKHGRLEETYMKTYLNQSAKAKERLLDMAMEKQLVRRRPLSHRTCQSLSSRD